jgi:hypothetical protein
LVNERVNKRVGRSFDSAKTSSPLYTAKIELNHYGETSMLLVPKWRAREWYDAMRKAYAGCLSFLSKTT